jgi:N4-gp56 family major capsid protein
MGDTVFKSSAPQTVKIWSAMLFKETRGQIFFGKFVGKDDKSLIQEKVDLSKERGDKIGFDLRMKLSGRGRTNDQTLEGQEEEMVFKHFATQVFLRQNGVKAKGKMTLRRTKHDIKVEGRDALADWMAEMIDDDTVLALSGLENPSLIDDDDVVVPAVPPSANRILYGGVSPAGVVGMVASDSLIANTSHAHLFGPKLLEILKRKAQLVRPKIRPVKVNGKEYYVCFIHPLQAKALTASEEWLADQRNANVRGTDNPIFSGMLGIYKGVVVHEYERIMTRLGEAGNGTGSYFDIRSNTEDNLPTGVMAARALFCGAQAGVHCYAQYPGWYEKDFDYNRVPGVATDVIYRADKTRFTLDGVSEDFAVICMDTAVEED